VQFGYLHHTGLDSPYYNGYDSALREGGEIHGAGILLQMSDKEGDQEPAERYFEEQKAGDTWDLSSLRYQTIPNRQGLIIRMF